MHQTTLNLIAVTIFTFVMASLLGPLLHLSPFVPAIAAVGLLSLTTVDQFGWQGQGGALLLDWFANFSATHRQRVIHHEAGHFLVAYLLNIPVTGYTLTAWEAWRQGYGGQGGVQVDSQHLTQAWAEGHEGQERVALLDRYCAVWMAGIAAELWIYGNVEGDRGDRETFRTFWAQVPRPRPDVTVKERWAILRARTLLHDHPEAYRALVDAIAERSTVSDCQRAIQSHLPVKPQALARDAS